MASDAASLAANSVVGNVARHIQDHDAAESTVPHWGYASRVVPCVNDPGSCAYLDVVYGANDIGMVYTGILWLTFAGIIFGWAVIRHVGRPGSSSTPTTVNDNETQAPVPAGRGGLHKARESLAAFKRRFFLPDAVRAIFGRTTRFQVSVLAALTGYLTIWSFAGITYNIWITPVSDMPGVYNTRTSLGPWSNRVGVLAYALTPLSVLLSNRESILSLLLGVPYQSFNFLHRWLGYIIFVQSWLHTIGWCIIQLRLYQPQPTVGVEWIKQEYMIWGLVAMILLTMLFLLSTPWGIRLTGYETFRKLHYVLAMVYIGACWAHWEPLKCFMIPSLIFWFLDRGARFVRTAFLHYQHLPSGNMGFRPAQAEIKVFPDPERGDVVRLELENDQDAWAIGKHFYLCFTGLSIWQSHPFTPLNAPIVRGGKVKHTYLLRAKGGETKKLAEMANRKLAAVAKPHGPITTPVILTGPYGEESMADVTTNTNIICVAGGTGITYVLPILLELSRQPVDPHRRVELIWAMRHANNTAWVREELDVLHKVQKALNLKVRLFATRDVGSKTPSVSETETNTPTKEKQESAAIKEIGSATSSAEDGICDCGDNVPVRKTGGAVVDVDRHPDLAKLIPDFVGATTVGPTAVFASGPGGMISDLRSIVASCNSGSRVWAGEERYNVQLVCDDRLEW
jgi:ferric-chelate reductase